MTLNKSQEIRFEKIVEKILKKNYDIVYTEEKLYKLQADEHYAEITFKISEFKSIKISKLYDKITRIESATWSITKNEINQYLTNLEKELS